MLPILKASKHFVVNFRLHSLSYLFSEHINAFPNMVNSNIRLFKESRVIHFGKILCQGKISSG